MPLNYTAYTLDEVTIEEVSAYVQDYLSKYTNQKDKLPEGMLESLSWEMALTLIGDHRIEANSLNRAGSRAGTRYFECGDDGDKDDDPEEAIERSYRKEFAWREDRISEDPATIYIRKETRQEVLANMTDKQREVFRLYYEEGYRQREIAEMLGIGQKSVSDRLNGALKQAKRCW